MMNKIVYTLLLFFAAGALIFAQSTTTLSGTITDAKGVGLIGVNVFIDGSYDGASTDLDGNYTFSTDQQGEQTLLVQYIGFADQQVALNLVGEPLTQKIVLKEASINLGVANVVAKRFGRTSDKNRTEILSTLDILTTGGSNADIVSALRTLPGTQQVGEQEGLFVRGGTGDETRIFVDGMRVANFFQSGAENVAQRGRFSPSLFKGTVFSSGGFSAAYGQALSGSLNLESVDMPNKSEMNASISSVGAQAEFIKLFNQDESAVSAAVNYMNLTPYYSLVSQDRTFEEMPVFLDASLNLRHKTSETGTFKYFGQIGRSSLAFRRDNLDYPAAEESFAINNRNLYSNLLYGDMIGDRFKIDLGLAVASNEDAIERDLPLEGLERSQQSLNRNTNYYQGRGTVTWLGDDSKVVGGVEHQRIYRTDRADSLSRDLREDYSAAFVEGTFTLFDRFSTRIGLRSEYSKSIDRYNLAPRIALNYDLTDRQQVSFAWGHYHQAPELSYADGGYGLDYQRATHYIMTYQRTEARRTFRAELFHKDYSDLLKTGPTISNDGFGYARGLELFWRDKKLVKDLDYWISYSFLDTERDFLDFPSVAQPTFAADHTASLAVKKFFPSITTNVSATFTYATGRPFYNPNLDVTDFLSSRTKDYQNLSFTVAHLTQIGGAFTTLVFSISNVMGNDQVFGYEYGTVDPTRRRAITPMAPRFIYFGAYFNWGVDKRQQASDSFM